MTKSRPRYQSAFGKIANWSEDEGQSMGSCEYIVRAYKDDFKASNSPVYNVYVSKAGEE